MGKQHRAPSDEGQAWRAKGVLQLIHVNVCEPIKMTSISSAMYFLLFVDGFTKRM
jgi:hypothetical protein